MIYVITIAIVAILLINVTGGVFLGMDTVGFGIKEDNRNYVEYHYWNEIYNFSFFTQKISFEITSLTDKEDGFLNNSELSIVKIEYPYVSKESESDFGIDYSLQSIKTITIELPPLSSESILIHCIGEYGGTGKAVRHGPEKVIVQYQ